MVYPFADCSTVYMEGGLGPVKVRLPIGLEVGVRGPSDDNEHYVIASRG